MKVKHLLLILLSFPLIYNQISVIDNFDIIFGNSAKGLHILQGILFILTWIFEIGFLICMNYTKIIELLNKKIL